jgi:hypothetical protein
MPHHLTVYGGKRQLMIAALRYYDTSVKVEGAWLFASVCCTLTGSKNRFSHDHD